MCRCNCCQSPGLPVVLSLLVLAMSGLSFLGPWWISVGADPFMIIKNGTKPDFTYGLWGYCDGPFPENCHMWPLIFYEVKEVVAWFYTCVGLFGLGFLITLLALPFVVTAVCRPPARTLHNVGGFGLICAGILMMVAVLGFAIFTFGGMSLGEFLVRGWRTLYFGFYLGFVAAFLAFITGIIVATRPRRGTKV